MNQLLTMEMKENLPVLLHMPYPDQFLQRKLDERIEGDFLRSLVLPDGLVDFCSNDYLGIVRHGLLDEYTQPGDRHGSGGSRSLAGNSALAEATETMIASFHHAEAALLFNSGFNANTGVLGAVPQRGDLILYDALAHASIRDGIRLSFAEAHAFRHNDMQDLEEKLRLRRTTAHGSIFIATETVFSMDGHLAPVEELVALCERYDAHLVIDEAHAISVCGERGEGMVQQAGLQDKVFARIYTYGKGPGCHGAAVVGSARLRSYLVNFARSFIFTTALPETAIRAIDASYRVFPGMQQERAQIAALIRQFRETPLRFEKLLSDTAVQGIIVPGNSEVKTVARLLAAAGLDVRPILYPSVPRGRERLRISLHAFNTAEELSTLTTLLT
jgi:8-amino-7-oxononanoate synthase